MKFVIAPDSFKESVDAKQAAYAIKSGLEKAFAHKDIEVKYDVIPVADGGEGTMQVITDALEGEWINCSLMGPLGTYIIGQYGYIKKTNKAVIEVAEACGLHLVEPQKRNPLLTTSYGVGELIQSAVNKGVKEMIIGLGGSSTNDGGVGMLSSLGAKFYSEEGEITPRSGKDLIHIKSVDLTPVFNLLKDVKIEVACDVENPLVGPKGASAIFAPQKGATQEDVEQLEEGMKQWCNVLETYLEKEVKTLPKGGAAGGLGAAFMLLGAQMKSGVELVLEATRFEERIQDATYVITGEGSIDAQTAGGKTISGIGRLCKRYNVPVIVVAGSVADDLQAVYDLGVSAVFGIVDKAKTLQEALQDGEKSLIKTAENIGRLLQQK